MPPRPRLGLRAADETGGSAAGGSPGSGAAAGGDGRRGVGRGDLAGALVLVSGASISSEMTSMGCVSSNTVGDTAGGRRPLGVARRRRPLRRLRSAASAAGCRRRRLRRRRPRPLPPRRRPRAPAAERRRRLVPDRPAAAPARGLGLAQRRHLGGELGRRLAPGALARLGRVAGERAGLRRCLGGRGGRAEAREPAGELLPLGLRARQLGLEAARSGRPSP